MQDGDLTGRLRERWYQDGQGGRASKRKDYCPPVKTAPISGLPTDCLSARAALVLSRLSLLLLCSPSLLSLFIPPSQSVLTLCILRTRP